jgi:hypothetical protein
MRTWVNQFMTLIFTTIGSAADYGTFGRWLLLFMTLVCWGAQFGVLGLKSKLQLPTPSFEANLNSQGPSQWRSAMAIYILGYISYGATLVFYAALFPRLARNTPRARHLRESLATGDISPEEFEREESLEKNRISNISTMHSNWGYLFTSAINLSILLPLNSSPFVDQYTIALTNA